MTTSEHASYQASEHGAAGELRDQIAEVLLKFWGRDGVARTPSAVKMSRAEADAIMAVVVAADEEMEMLAQAHARAAAERDDAVLRAERAEAKVAEYEQYEADVTRILDAKNEALGRAEAAIEQALAYCAEIEAHCSAERLDPPPWVASVRAHLGQPPADTGKGCCDECDGSGYSGDGDTGGACWTCRGTGHPHDGPCALPDDTEVVSVRPGETPREIANRHLPESDHE
jgi:hypothetical protein